MNIFGAIMQDLEDRLLRFNWRLTSCSKGNHFVGMSIYKGTVYCDICKTVPKKIKRKKDGTLDGWTW